MKLRPIFTGFINNSKKHRIFYVDYDKEDVLNLMKTNPIILDERGIPFTGTVKNKYGNVLSYVDGKIHNDIEPAVIQKNGTKKWYNNYMIHRGDDLPAIIYPNGDKAWYIKGKKERNNKQPAIENVNGDKEWWINGKRHREDGPAIEYQNGGKEWWINGVLHKINGPAIDNVNGNNEWWINGKLHREDGPAIEREDGTKEYWLDGIRLNKNKIKLENNSKEFLIIKKTPNWVSILKLRFEEENKKKQQEWAEKYKK